MSINVDIKSSNLPKTETNSNVVNLNLSPSKELSSPTKSIKSLRISSISAINLYDTDTNMKNQQHRRYKKNHISKDYKPVLNSPISKLTDRVRRYCSDSISEEELYKILIKNNIDPDNKKVINVLKDLELETNKNQKSTIKKLLLAKDDKTSKYDDLDNKLQTVKPVKQTLTSNEVDPNVIDISYCVPGSSTKNSMSASHSNLIKKRKFDLENTQLNSSLSFYPNKETKIEKGRDIFTSDSNLNKELFVKSSGNRDVSLNSSLTHKDLKINFMRASNVFPPKSDIKKNSEFNKENNSKSNSLAKKFSGSIIHNYSTHKNLYSSGKQEIFTVPVGKGGKSYKNAVSELNTSAVIKKPNNATSTQIKIVGLVGRSKVNNENADQSKSTIGKLIEWVPKNKKNLSVDKKLNSELSFASQKTADSFNKNSKVNSNVNSTKLPVKTLKTSSSNINLSDSAQSFNKFKSQSISGNISSSSTKNRNNGNYKFLNLLKNKA